GERGQDAAVLLGVLPPMALEGRDFLYQGFLQSLQLRDVRFLVIRDGLLAQLRGRRRSIAAFAAVGDPERHSERQGNDRRTPSHVRISTGGAPAGRGMDQVPGECALTGRNASPFGASAIDDGQHNTTKANKKPSPYRVAREGFRAACICCQKGDE